MRRDTTGPLRVGFDATALLGRPTGVGVVAERLLDGLSRRDDLRITAFAVSWRGRGGLRGAVPAGVTSARRPAPARPLRALWRRADYPPVECWTGPLDVVHGPNFVVPPSRRAGEVVTVHDLTCVRYPELCTADTLAYPALLRRALGRGALVHAVSEFVAAEVIELLGADPDRVTAIPNGAPPPGPAGDPDRGHRLAGTAPDQRYVLAVGTVEPRKDLPGLVRAFTAVAADHPDLRLVIAGPDGWGSAALTDAVFHAPDVVRSAVRRLGWVDDGERADLLAGAAVLAYPSRYEGFGLVPLEAMAAGTPVVTTDAGALPEVVGDAAEVVPVGDTDALASALTRVLDDEHLATALTARGRARLQRFSWSAAVDAIADLYHRARR